MKTAVYIPDSVFEAAEALAQRLGMSRSELYRHAVQAYVDSHRNDKVREALDKVYADESLDLDDALSLMQRYSLPEEDW